MNVNPLFGVCFRKDDVFFIPYSPYYKDILRVRTYKLEEDRGWILQKDTLMQEKEISELTKLELYFKVASVKANTVLTKEDLNMGMVDQN